MDACAARHLHGVDRPTHEAARRRQWYLVDGHAVLDHFEHEGRLRRRVAGSPVRYGWAAVDAFGGHRCGSESRAMFELSKETVSDAPPDKARAWAAAPGDS